MCMCRHAWACVGQRLTPVSSSITLYVFIEAQLAEINEFIVFMYTAKVRDHLQKV